MNVVMALAGLLISVLGGSFLIYFLKKTLVDEKTLFHFDGSGMAERLILTSLFILNGKWLFFMPLIIVLRVIFNLLFEEKLSNWVAVILRETPALAYQRVKLKGFIAIDWLVSPLFGILAGIFLKGALK